MVRITALILTPVITCVVVEMVARIQNMQLQFNAKDPIKNVFIRGRLIYFFFLRADIDAEYWHLRKTDNIT